MKELFKVVTKRVFVYSFIINLLYSLADYGESFVLGYFGTSPLTIDKVIKLTIAIVILDILTLIFEKIGLYVDNIMEVKTHTEIEKYYFSKMQNMTMKKLSTIHTGYLNKMIGKVIRYFIDTIYFFEIGVIPALIGGTAIFIMLCKQSVVTGIICLIISIVAVTLKYKMLKDTQKYEKDENDAESRYNGTLIDFIQNIITVKKLNIGRYCENKIDKSSNEYLDKSKKNLKKRVRANGVYTSLMNLLYLVVLISVIITIKQGKDGLPFLLFYMSVLGKIYYSLNHVVRVIDFNQRFRTAKKQIDSYFSDVSDTKLIKDYKNIKLRNVIFSYTQDSEKIKIPEFILNKGDKISITGESGQGKTTVMNILSGLYPIEKGEILINNKKLKNEMLDLVFVSQEVDLFNLSIRDNLVLGNNISDEKIEKLLKEAGMESWYKNLPNGLDTVVGERGMKLSAGQKQRLNLIRGILIDKELYFFDEPTSNLDIASEEKVINMIDKYLKDKTYVIVTHRPKLKELCNKHYVFEEHMMKELMNV